jgi:hypothetical protein
MRITQCALANCYRIWTACASTIANTILRDLTQFSTVCKVCASDLLLYAHRTVLPIYLNKVSTDEKSEKSEKAISTPLSGPQRNESETTFFCANSKSKIFASVHCAYASKDKMVQIWPTLKKKILFFIPKVPYL